MKWTIKLILLSCFFVSTANSQQIKNVKPQVVMTLQGGIMEGQTDKTVPQFQLLGGIQKNAWLLSLGGGMDYYGHKRSVPVFVDAKYLVGKTKNNFFGYAAGGYNFSWLRDDEKIRNWWNTLSNDEKGGIYYEAGIGYKVNLKNRFGFGLSAGYSYKEQSEKIKNKNNCDFCVPQQPNDATPEIYKYQFRRVSIRLHCWF